VVETLFGQTLTQGEKHLLQKLSIVDNSDLNPLVPSHTSTSRNYQLKTIRKNVNQAINEIADKVNGILGTVDNFTERFNRVIGNEDNEDKEDWVTLKTKYVNIIRAVVEVRELVEAHKDMIETLSGETIMATLNEHLPHYGMSVNEYANRQVGAIVLQSYQFDNLDAKDDKNIGTYFVEN